MEIKIKQGELSVLNTSLAYVKSTKSMSGEDYFNLMDLKECVTGAIEKLGKAQKEILDTFKVKLTEKGAIEDVESKEWKKAEPKLSELLSMEVTINPVNFIEDKQVYKDATEDLTLEGATYCRKYLMKK